MKLHLQWADGGLLPDRLIRWGIRLLNQKRLRDENPGSLEAAARAKIDFVHMLQESPVALATKLANEQHYELPPQFFQKILGKRLKYSGCLWPPGVKDLEGAEEAMLSLTCRRAQLEDGMRVLDLGCGWGSLSIWIAEKYPASQIVAVSNSRLQGDFIRSRARELGFSNIETITADMNHFQAHGPFNRVMSIEMFEHMRNWEKLLGRVAGWLEEKGKFFMHVFVHQTIPYLFEPKGDHDWMARHFFTGGMMPSHDLALYFQRDLVLENHWLVNGSHYEKTAEAWLRRLDQQRKEILTLFTKVYGEKERAIWLQRWRIFFMACSELFGARHGEEWLVAHHLMRKRL